MGQRLNVEIKENDEILANAYYHWSGYTSSAIGTALDILKGMDSVEQYQDRRVYAIKLLELSGSGLTDDEMEYVKNNIPDYEKYEFKMTTGRNNGLTAISEKGMNTTRCWEEARVTIDLTTKTVTVDATFIEDVKDWEEANGIKCELPRHNVDFDNIPFDKVHEVYEFVRELNDKCMYGFRLSDTEVCSFIV